MTKRSIFILALSDCFASSTALAQAAQPAERAPVPAEAIAPKPQVPAGKASLVPEPGQARIESPATKVAPLAVGEPVPPVTLAGGSRLRLSGYAQGRYEWHDGSTNGATFSSTGVATPTNQNRFLLRRAQLTTHYSGSYAELLIQLEANTKEGLGLKDGYVSIIEPWTPLKMKLMVGQFRYPFGYEVQQMNVDLEMPERALIEKYFFEGERDRGVRLQGGYRWLNFRVALVNGTVWDGTRNLAASKDPAPFGKDDPNEFKDWVGRVGVDFGFLVGGASGYFGKGLYLKPPVAATATTLATDPVPDSRWKYRFGADLQGYVPVPSVGVLALRGEVIWGQDTARPFHGIPANPCNASATWGFILSAVQRLPGNLGVVVRVDMKDTLARSFADQCTAERTKAETDRVITTGAGLLYYASPNLRLTATYEHPTEQSPNRRDNDFAMGQIQAMFR